MSEEVKKSKETAEVKKPDGNELVDYMAPLLGNDRDKPILVCVNGETCRIMRGEPVKIKRKFYNALMNAQRQELAAYAAMRNLQQQGKKPIAEM